MLQDQSTIEYKHKKFIERVVAQETVWGLQSEDGFATAESNDFEDAQVIPFWSDKAYAGVLIKEEWSRYEPARLTLSEFLENWLIGMSNDGLLTGTNWDANMFGKEVDPLELGLQIVDEILASGKTVSLEKYKDILEYQADLREALR